MPGRDRYSPDEDKTSVEIVEPGNPEGADGNWRWITSGDDLVLQKKVSGTWTKVETTKGS